MILENKGILLAQRPYGLVVKVLLGGKYLLDMFNLSEARHRRRTVHLDLFSLRKKI